MKASKRIIPFLGMALMMGVADVVSAATYTLSETATHVGGLINVTTYTPSVSDTITVNVPKGKRAWVRFTWTSSDQSDLAMPCGIKLYNGGTLLSENSQYSSSKKVADFTKGASHLVAVLEETSMLTINVFGTAHATTVWTWVGGRQVPAPGAPSPNMHYNVAYELQVSYDIPLTLSLDPTSLSKSRYSGTGTISVTANTSWKATSNSSWIHITSGSSGYQNGKISYSYDANNSSDTRTGAIKVAAGSLERTVTITQSGDTTKPDLKPYAPSAWGRPIIVTKTKDGESNLTTAKDSDSLYVRCAFDCNDKVAASNFKSALYLDGSVVKTWDCTPIALDKYQPLTYSLGKLSAGTHKLKFVVDSGSVISESLEGNNTCETSISITSTLLVVKPNNAKYGSATVSGTIAKGNTVSLSATAKSGYVFTGWFKDKDCTVKLNPSGYDNRASYVRYTVPQWNSTVYAKFNLITTDKKSLKFSDSTKKLAKTAKNYSVGASVSLKLGISSKSLPTVTASGLPSGLSINSRTGAITGSSTKPGSYTVKVTVKNAAGNSIAQNVKINVKVPSWASGKFYGYGVIDSITPEPVELKYSVSSVGKVSGKAIYRGVDYPFTASYTSCTSKKAKFTMPIALVSEAYYVDATVCQETHGLTYTCASGDAGGFYFTVMKKVPLVQKGKSLAGMIGKSYVFKKGYKNAGLTKQGDKLVVKFYDKDTVRFSGIVKGRKFTGYSAALLACGKSKSDGTTRYKLEAAVIEPTTGYQTLLTFKPTIDSKKRVIKVTKAFSALYDELVLYDGLEVKAW